MRSRGEAIESLPVHQRPSPGELGRRSEPADHPFKAMRTDDGHRASLRSRISTAAGTRRPLVTAIQNRQKIVIAAADAGALALGLMPGMALTQARALVPDLDVRDAAPAADRALLDRLAMLAMRRWTPTVMLDEDDGLLLDLTGVSHLHGGEERMGRRLLHVCARLGLEARLAIAGSIGAAHALARHGARALILCEPCGEPTAIAALPIAALRLDARQRDAARRLGLDRVGDILAMPRAPLAKRFGASFLDRLDQAIGRVPEPFDAITPFVVPRVEMRFPEPIAAAGSVAAAMAELVGRLSTQLRDRGLGVRVLRLSCDRVDRVDQIITVGLARATRDVRHMLRLLEMRIETIDPGFGIDAMQLTAVRSEPVAPAHIDGDLSGEEVVPDVATLVDQITARLGRRAIFRSGAIESHVPERSVRLLAPTESPVDWPMRWPRPVRILRRPEQLDGVIALLPDQPPRRFSWRGDVHVVVCADGPERIVGEWWKRTREAYSVRDYFRLEDVNGQRFWVFRRGDGQNPLTGDLSWHMHGFFG